MPVTLRQEVARELQEASKKSVAQEYLDRSRRMWEVLGLTPDSELVLAVLSDEQCQRLLDFLRIYNKPNKTRYDLINLDMVIHAAEDA